MIKSHPVLQSIVSSIPIIFPGSLSEWMGRPQVQPGTSEISVVNFSMDIGVSYCGWASEIQITSG